MAQVMGDAQLFTIAREVAATVGANATIDWIVQESFRAKMRRMVRRLLHKRGYPPDHAVDPTFTIVEQAERLAAVMAA